jgi:hypothetical protein
LEGLELLVALLEFASQQFGSEPPTGRCLGQ